MSRLLLALLMLALTFALSACQSGDEEEDAPKVAAVQVVLHAPATADDKEWKKYLQEVVGQNMAGVTDRVFPYYLPANSTAPTPGDPENRSQFDRQLDNVGTVLSRSVLPDALKGSQVLFIGKTEDSARVQASVEAVGGKYIFVEAK